MFFFLPVACGLLEKLLQRDDAGEKYFDLVLHSNSVLKIQLSEGNLGRSVRTDLIFGIDDGDGFQDGFERPKCFSCPLGEIDHECGTPESPVNRAPILNWWGSIRIVLV